ncbi:efflux system membrane protein [Klebsiella variicola]|uniref:Efflux system membrane protein n=1 Tax=Klebsiella variicola TaxID=244366 RepID=A0A7H4M8H0_KLEVA|nr:efflux system membrane protein [Klebsiella variicola]
MSLFPVIVIFGLSFPPIFFELLLSLAIFWLVHRLLVSDRHLRFCLAPCTV